MLVRSLIVGLDVLLPDLLRNPGLGFWVEFVFVQGVNLSLPGRHLLRLLSLHESAKQLGHPSSWDKEVLRVSVPQVRKRKGRPTLPTAEHWTSLGEEPRP